MPEYVTTTRASAVKMTSHAYLESVGLPKEAWGKTCIPGYLATDALDSKWYSEVDFHAKYTQVTELSFYSALACLQEGLHLKRKPWKDCFVTYDVTTNSGVPTLHVTGSPPEDWNIQKEDMEASDWEIVQ